MDYMKFSEFLGNLETSNYLFLFEPEILDFTEKEEITLHIYATGGHKFSLEMKHNLDNVELAGILGILVKTIFAKGSRVITWNWKNFVTYILGKGGKPFICDATIIDLKIIESYLGIKNSAPQSIGEALSRMKKVMAEPNYKESSKVYRNIHLPLMTTVLPHLETVGIVDPDSEGRVYAYYEIDGQENGRLLCHRAYSKGYIPHNLTEEKKAKLKPLPDHLFMYFDFNSMEVFMLAWLTKDPLLNELCEKDDVYFALYEKIIGEQTNLKEARDKCKKFFLPVIYGMSAHTLADRIKIAEATAETIVKRIHELFPTALAWVQAYQDQVKERGYADDIFGKRRYFDGKEYRGRNFSVQSPASIVCLEKLIQLYHALVPLTKLAYHVHDGYMVYTTKEKWREVYTKAIAALSSESQMCPGLKLRVSAKAGKNLNELKNIIKKE